MYVIHARNVQAALYDGLDLLRTGGYRRDSRNGPVIKMDGPVTTLYDEPRERVLSWAARDANPFFHLFESLWMLAGRQDIAPLSWYVKRMDSFADGRGTLHGAYGYRWRVKFEVDQLKVIAGRLKRLPDDRRCVLQMYSASYDGVSLETSKDIPCNTAAYFARGKRGELNMTVTCRSNDIVWGAYGANAVHFSMLQEYLAAHIECEVGRYWQISNDFHAYADVVEPLFKAGREWCPYSLPNPCVPMKLIKDPDIFDQELRMFMDKVDTHPLAVSEINYAEPFFKGVAVPMHMAYYFHKQRKYDLALDCVKDIAADDWRLAALEWIITRQAAYNKKMEDS